MLRVVTFHRVAEPSTTPGLDPALVSATPHVFRRQMAHLRSRYQPVSLARVLEAFLAGRPLPPRAVHVTFDDAYRDFAEVAWPVLRGLEIPVTLFVPTAYPGQPSRAFWWDRLHRATTGPAATSDRASPCGAASPRATPSARASKDPNHRRTRALLRELPHDELEAWVDVISSGESLRPERSQPGAVLDWDELRALHREGVAIGVHTRHHVGLTRVTEARARSEVRGSIEDVRREIGERPNALAYPYGMYDDRVVEIARQEGCVVAFTCEDGLNDAAKTHPLRLRRTNVTRKTAIPVFKLRMLPWFAGVDRWRHLRRSRDAHL